MTTAPDQPRRIEYLLLDDLIPALDNPKDHDDPGIVRSIEKFGVVEPQVLDERTGRLVVGHGRWENLLALAAKGGSAPEGVVVDDDGRWRVPVVRGWASVDDAHAEAYLIASNHLTTRGGWIEDDLVAMLTRLDTASLLDVTGFGRDDFDDLVARLGPPPDLDDLGDKYGDPDPSRMWPVLRFKVPTEMRARYLALVDGREGSDADLFGYVLDLAEATARP